MTIFEFDNYKNYIISMLEPLKGGRLKLSRSIRCQTSYLSRVLNGDQNLSLEQSFDTCKFFGLNELEKDYFINLVSFERSGHDDLKIFYKKKINIIKKSQEKISSRISKSKALTGEHRNHYYSKWYISAIHVAVDIFPNDPTEDLSRILSLSKEVISKEILFLIKAGLINKKGHGYKMTNKEVHLDNESNLYKLYQSCWKHFILDQLNKNDENIHYTTVFTISKADNEKLKKKIYEFIDKSRELIGPSKEEELASLSIDYIKFVKP